MKLFDTFNKKLGLYFLCLITIIGYAGPVQAEQLARPNYVALHLKDEAGGNYSGFVLSWKDGKKIQEKILSGSKVAYEIDFRQNNENWLSQNKQALINGQIKKGQDPQKKVEISAAIIGQAGKLDIFQNNYSFRVRYLVDGKPGPFSNIVRVGMRPGYDNASPWSQEELNLANTNGFISPQISRDMKVKMSRAEFSDILVRIYEKIEKSHLVTGESVYKDTNDPSVLKATKLGIVQGTGGNYFKPDAPITRQEMATMLARFLLVMDQPLEEVSSQEQFKDHRQISTWALEAVYRLQGLGLIQGDQKGNFLPKNNTSREEGVVVGQRTYELLDPSA